MLCLHDSLRVLSIHPHPYQGLIFVLDHSYLQIFLSQSVKIVFTFPINFIPPDCPRNSNRDSQIRQSCLLPDSEGADKHKHDDDDDGDDDDDDDDDLTFEVEAGRGHDNMPTSNIAITAFILYQLSSFYVALVEETLLWDLVH